MHCMQAVRGDLSGSLIIIEVAAGTMAPGNHAVICARNGNASIGDNSSGSSSDVADTFTVRSILDHPIRAWLLQHDAV
jgi:hypothetical protein